MPAVTVRLPSVDTEAIFSFKEPFNTYIKNRINAETNSYKLKVVSVIAMRDIIRNDLRDPFSDLYTPANVSEQEYKKDLVDNIPIISFYYLDERGVEKFVRAPLNYIESISSITDVDYHNKLIIIDLKKLPASLCLDPYFNDIKDTIRTRIGVEANIKEVAVGVITPVSTNEHIIRESIRNNNVTVHKTLEIRLQEITLERDEILRRLQELNITLGS